MFLLSDPLKAEIRFQSVYIKLKDTLAIINKNRFVALGDQHCEKFVRHGLNYADEIELTEVSNVAYILFLMSYLGSFFYEDPRYEILASSLKQQTAEEIKITEAREIFMALSRQYIGNNGEIFREVLSNFQNLTHIVSNDEVSFTNCHDEILKQYPFTDLDRTVYPREKLEQNSIKAAETLGISTPLGTKTCLVLSFALGIGFANDPLYPWVKDKIKEGKKGQQTAELLLYQYALKRMNIMIKKA
jgi:hypothetical protein